MAGPSGWIIYDQFKVAFGKKVIDLSADSFSIALFTFNSNAINRSVADASYTNFAADGHEVSNAGGYITGGASAGTGTWTDSAGTESFGVATTQWLASGPGFSARAAVLYCASDPAKHAVGYFLLDSAPADVVVTAGKLLAIIAPIMFALAGGEV